MCRGDARRELRRPDGWQDFRSGPGIMILLALTIFLGAFLLFQVQPLMAKFILPWFGGGPGMWTTCLLFFQVRLLAGYAYAHAVSRCFQGALRRVCMWRCCWPRWRFCQSCRARTG